MRVIPGPPKHFSDRTMTVPQLMELGLSKPEILPYTLNLWERNYTTVSSLLGRRGLGAGSNLYEGVNSDRYRVVGNRKVMWRSQGVSIRKAKIITGPVGATPGINGAHVELVLSNDWFSVNDILELANRDTQVFVHTKERVSDGYCRYRVQLVDNRPGAFIDPTLLTSGKEIGFGHTAFPELSDDAGEKHTFDEWETAYLGIQRMKFTISGSAANTKVYLEHNGQPMWEYKQNLDMLARWGRAHEHSNLFGRATIDAAENVYLRDMQGRDVVKGDGLFRQGDAGLKFTYNTLNFRLLDRILSQMDIMMGSDGNHEVMLIAGSEFTSAFERLMVDVVQANPIPIVEVGANGQKGIDTSFNYYKHNGVKIVVAKSRFMDNPYHPQEFDTYGRSIFSQSGFFVSLGDLPGGNPNVELISLGNGNEDRSFVQRVINGMTGKGALVDGEGTGRIQVASSPVDGKQVHILSETGIVLRNRYGVATLSRSRRGAN